MNGCAPQDERTQASRAQHGRFIHERGQRGRLPGVSDGNYEVESAFIERRFHQLHSTVGKVWLELYDVISDGVRREIVEEDASFFWMNKVGDVHLDDSRALRRLLDVDLLIFLADLPVDKTEIWAVEYSLSAHRNFLYISGYEFVDAVA